MEEITPEELAKARQARREYMRKWQQKNREHVRAYQRAYYAANKAQSQNYKDMYWLRKANEVAEKKK